MLKKIQSKSEEYHQEIVDIRRHLHANPELSFEEYKTSEFVQTKLTEWGIKFQNNIANTGVVAKIEGNDPNSKVIALRGDMDALPITETNDIDYKSKNEGVMHACGHDVHTSCLLGAAKILNEIKGELSGTIRLIFQPAEEKFPGGASQMIEEGVLDNPKVNSIIGQHVMPDFEAGKVGFRSGTYMASADEIYIKVIGKGGHAAMPERNIDPVLISAHIITSLQQIVSRNSRPDTPCVLSIGKVIADGATNVIPDEVYMEGTFRTFDEEWRELAHEKIKNIAISLVEGMGAKCEIEIKKGYPVLINNEALANRSKQFAIEYLGKENVLDLDLWMAGEDFAYYSHHTDACFYRLGIRNEAKGITSSVHTPTFDIDEDALKTGVGLMAWLAVNELSS